jgi:hypothetical protein
VNSQILEFVCHFTKHNSASILPTALCRLLGFEELSSDNGTGLEHDFQIE